MKNTDGKSDHVIMCGIEQKQLHADKKNCSYQNKIRQISSAYQTGWTITGSQTHKRKGLVKIH